MKYIKDYKEGDRICDIYLCKHKQAAVTKNGKPYDNVILQDKTGTMDAKVWEPNSAGISEYDINDYIEVTGDVNSFQGALQVSVKRIRVCHEEEYVASDYLPVSKKDIEAMYGEFKAAIERTQNPFIKQFLQEMFIHDETFVTKFKTSSAAKTVHHGFVGGLLEHTLSVVKLSEFLSMQYKELNRDLLVCTAMCHDIGKIKELSLFPENDYTDDGQFLGHIIMGIEMMTEKINQIPNFPPRLASEIKHCVLAHHGKLEFGSPKKPAILEALALNFADETDAKMQTFIEALEKKDEDGWLGYNRLFESNIIKTRME